MISRNTLTRNNYYMKMTTIEKRHYKRPRMRVVEMLHHPELLQASAYLNVTYGEEDI